MQPHPLGRGEQAAGEADLHQRLPAGDGEPAAHGAQRRREVAEPPDRMREVDRVPSLRCQVSGLWQYWQRRKQPDMNSINRTPGPSTVEPVS